MSERVSDPLAKYAKRIQSGRDAIAVKRPTAWDVAVVEFADALLDSRARVKELEEALQVMWDYAKALEGALLCKDLPGDLDITTPHEIAMRVLREEGGG
jgi:hypothetical protein